MAASTRPPMEETMTEPRMPTQTPAEKYEAFFVPAIFGPWAERLVELAGIEPGQSLLDLACGTGIVARTAAPILGRGGRIVALDLRPGMLAAARTLPGPEGFFSPGMWLGMTIVLSFGIIFQPHMIVRYYSAVSARTLKWLGATTPIYLMTLYIPAALVGLGGALALPGLEIPDRVFPELLFRYASPWLTGAILAGATAAAMSTLDSILHANMTVLTRDVYQRYVAPEASQAHYIWVGRALVLALLVVGYVLTVTTIEYHVVLVTL
jgi:hypothetical protein